MKLKLAALILAASCLPAMAAVPLPAQGNMAVISGRAHIDLAPTEPISISTGPAHPTPLWDTSPSATAAPSLAFIIWKAAGWPYRAWW